MLAKSSSRLGFFILKTRLAFAKLRQIFIKATILHYFNLKCHMQIKIDVSGYVIDRIFS